jgi:HSP20 family molecular chaperone IbpA
LRGNDYGNGDTGYTYREWGAEARDHRGRNRDRTRHRNRNTDAENIDARVEQGVLRLTIKKKAESKPRRIEVKS